MADLTPTSTWNDIFKLETTTQVLGGDDTAPANDPHHDLACRTEYLKDLQKHSIRYLSHSFPTPTTASNPAKKLFTIQSVVDDILNLKLVLFLKDTQNHKAFLEIDFSADTGLTLGSHKFAFTYFSEIIYIVVKVVSSQYEVWIECENLNQIEVVVSPIYDETSSFGGWFLENGVKTVNIVWSNDSVNSSIISTSTSHTTLKFVSFSASSNVRKQIELMASNLMGLPVDGSNNLIEKYENTIPDYLPIGSVIMWYGNVAYVPKKWQVCDGTNGTPNLSDKFVKGSVNDGSVGSMGGSDTNTASFTTNYDGSHQHSGTTGSANLSQRTTEGNAVLTPTTPVAHTHNFTTNNDGSHQHSGTTESFSIVPSFVSLYFIMKITA